MDLSALIRLFCFHPIRTLEAPAYVTPVLSWQLCGPQ